MSYNFPPPLPMSLSVAEFLLQMLVQVFLLAAAFGLVPPCQQMPASCMRRRLAVAGSLLCLSAVVGLKAPVEHFAAVDIIIAMFVVIRLILRALRWRFSLVSGCGALLLGVGLSSVTVIFPAYRLWYDSLWKKRPDCKLRLSNLELAMQNWASENEGRFPDSSSDRAGEPPASWRVVLLPFLYWRDLHASYSFAEPWDSDGNQRLARTEVRDFGCPANYFPADESGRFFSAFAAVTGPKTAFPGGKGMTLQAISSADGLGHTILIGESSGLNIIWSEPRDIDVSKQNIGINLPGKRPHFSSSILSSYHAGGTNVVFADGRARFLSEKIAPKVLQALTTATGGENVPDDGW
jgi:prepilin-type processing-associated H-X9-DG protein